jgi:hypothetical protein
MHVTKPHPCTTVFTLTVHHCTHLGDLAEGEAEHLWHVPGSREQAPHLLALLQPPLEPGKAALKPVKLGRIAAHAEDGLQDDTQ